MSCVFDSGPVHVGDHYSYVSTNNSSSVISPAEFLSLTAFSICSTPSRVKRFGSDNIPMFLHTCTIMIIIVIMTITMIDSINVVVCTGFSESMIIIVISQTIGFQRYYYCAHSAFSIIYIQYMVYRNGQKA